MTENRFNVHLHGPESHVSQDLHFGREGKLPQGVCLVNSEQRWEGGCGGELSRPQLDSGAC